MDFPHLRRDTEYPYINNVDVYEFQNSFDYSRWNEKTKIHLVNVLWNSDYANVVKFDSDAARDSYFDSIDDEYVIELEQAARIVPEGFIKLPIPYDVLALYNYLYIEMPIATSAENMIDWETTEGKKRWYFFIESIAYRAPSTTEVRVIPDIWTNYQNHVEINYLMLERGHAPVAYSDTDDYLTLPIQNSEYLLAPDIDYGKSSIVASADYIPFGNGEKYVVIISNIYPSQISSIGSVVTGSGDTWSNPTYSNTQDRFGYQLQVNGYHFGDAGDYSSLNTPVGNGASDILPNNVSAYALPAVDCFGEFASFFQDLKSKVPNFMQTIVAMLIVPKDMLTLDIGITLAGHTVYPCVGKASFVKDITLTKSMFGFPEKFERFAKLYTFPYSSLELTDNDGKKINVKIEETGHITCDKFSSVAFPFLDFRVMFNGINGVGSSNYSWQRIDGTTVNKLMPNSDWFENSFDWSIPTYSLYMDGKTMYNLTNYNGMLNARRDALVGYHVSVRSGNTAYENAVDAANTAESNVYASANNMVADMVNTTNCQTWNNTAATDCNTANTESANFHASAITVHNNTQIDQDSGSTNYCNLSTATAENQVSISSAANSGGASINMGAVNGGLSGIGMAAGAVAAGVAGPVGFLGIAGGVAALGAMTAIGSASANHANTMLATQCNSAVAAKVSERNSDVARHAKTANSGNTDQMNQDRSAQTYNTNQCMNTQTTNTTNCETWNTNNDANTMKANATRTKNTSNANSGYTRQVAILNAKEILENAQDKAHARYNDARNNIPTPICPMSGNPQSDYFETRGIQVKVRTESQSAIAQAASYFARYGYALNQMWDVNESGLTLMNYFTYWKASDIWVDDSKASNNGVNRAIENMFLNGVTIWDNPEEIGRVDIYAN